MTAALLLVPARLDTAAQLANAATSLPQCTLGRVSSPSFCREWRQNSGMGNGALFSRLLVRCALMGVLEDVRGAEAAVAMTSYSARARGLAAETSAHTARRRPPRSSGPLAAYRRMRPRCQARNDSFRQLLPSNLSVGSTIIARVSIDAIRRSRSVQPDARCRVLRSRSCPIYSAGTASCAASSRRTLCVLRSTSLPASAAGRRGTREYRHLAKDLKEDGSIRGLWTWSRDRVRVHYNGWVLFVLK